MRALQRGHVQLTWARSMLAGIGHRSLWVQLVHVSRTHTISPRPLGRGTGYSLTRRGLGCFGP